LALNLLLAKNRKPKQTQTDKQKRIHNTQNDALLSYYIWPTIRSHEKIQWKIKIYTRGTTIKTIFKQANKWRRMGKSRIPIVRQTSCAYLLASCPVWTIVCCPGGNEAKKRKVNQAKRPPN